MNEIKMEAFPEAERTLVSQPSDISPHIYNEMLPVTTSMNFSHTTSTTLINTKAMEWTNDDALELIEQYRTHTELWNRSDPKYKDKLCRFRAWSEIADSFGCSKAEVERKMNVLLTQYRREKHKMLVKLYQGIQPNPSKWYAFKRFDFMEAGGGSSSSSVGGVPAIGSGTNGHTTVAATAAALNGLAAAAGFETANAAATSGSHHRRMKCKELKYFGAMGLNLPMLLANTQALDSWNTVGQFSPPIGDRSQLRVPLPMSFSSSQSELNVVAGAAPRSLYGSSNSDLAGSPQKQLESSADMDDKDEAKLERTCSPNLHESGAQGSGAAVGCAGGGGSTGSIAGTEAGSSPIPNTNTHEAHQSRHESHDQDDLDIKRELVDYFHAPHPPAPPDSHRSYSSTDENRPGGGTDSDEFAQDLRISAAAAAAKGLDFSQFVLPRNLRRSSDSTDEKFMPLNMRKLSTTSAGTTNTGHMLMNSLLSHESMSEDTSASGRGIKSGGGSQEASSSAAAAAAAFYAESLNRDDCDFIGSNVTLKLRAMDRTQRIIAEKLISEVLFYGQFNELERTARIQPK